MFKDYQRYIINIRNSLIQNGVAVPVEDVNTYFDVFELACKLDEILYFYRILDISGSQYALNNFFLPLNGYFKEEIRCIVGQEFTDQLEDYKKLTGIKDEDDLNEYLVNNSKGLIENNQEAFENDFFPDEEFVEESVEDDFVSNEDNDKLVNEKESVETDTTQDITNLVFSNENEENPQKEVKYKPVFDFNQFRNIASEIGNNPIENIKNMNSSYKVGFSSRDDEYVPNGVYLEDIDTSNISEESESTISDDPEDEYVSNGQYIEDIPSSENTDSTTHEESITSNSGDTDEYVDRGTYLEDIPSLSQQENSPNEDIEENSEESSNNFFFEDEETEDNSEDEEDNSSEVQYDENGYEIEDNEEHIPYNYEDEEEEESEDSSEVQYDENGYEIEDNVKHIPYDESEEDEVENTSNLESKKLNNISTTTDQCKKSKSNFSEVDMSDLVQTGVNNIINGAIKNIFSKKK